MSWHDLFDGSDAHLLPSGIAECAAYLRKHNAWRRGDDGIEASHPRELGLHIDFAIAVLDAMSAHDHLMVIAAFRYCIGRQTYIVGDCADWLINTWPLLSDQTKAIIQRDLEEQFELDDRARAKALKRNTAGQRANGKNAGGRSAKYLFSGLLKCGICGGAYTLRGSRYYGCSTHNNRGDSVCSNRTTVKKATIERVLLAGIKQELLSDEAFKAFEAEARALLKQARPDPASARRRLTSAKHDLDNLMAAIKAGIITPTTKAALHEAEQQMETAKEELAAIERFEPTQMLPRAREIYRDMVSRLETIDDVTSAREALRTLIGDVRLLPENGKLTAEIQSAGLAGALYETVVAGACLERYELAPLRFPGLD